MVPTTMAAVSVCWNGGVRGLYGRGNSTTAVVSGPRPSLLDGGTVDDNAATSIGGGMFAQNDAISPAVPSEWQRGWSSGGIRTENTATFINSKIISGTTAGGVVSQPLAILTRCYQRNIAAISGGIITSNATLTDCTVSATVLDYAAAD